MPANPAPFIRKGPNNRFALVLPVKGNIEVELLLRAQTPADAAAVKNAIESLVQAAAAKLAAPIKGQPVAAQPAR